MNAGLTSISDEEIERERAKWLFSYLLLFQACMEGFAHGANDTANATAPFSAILTIYEKGAFGDTCEELGTTKRYTLVVAGLCVAAGVCTLGWRVMMTMGERIS